MVTTLPPRTPASEVDRRLSDLTDGRFMVAVEVFDHPDADVHPAHAQEADPGSERGAWVLGEPDEVQAHLERNGWEHFTEQYAVGHDEAS